jgi:hypothetical protein
MGGAAPTPRRGSFQTCDAALSRFCRDWHLTPERGSAGSFAIGRCRMRWWRSRRQIGSCMALLALCIQLTAAFAHIHSEDFSRSADSHSSSALAAGKSGAPWHPDDGRGHEDCAICAAIFLANTAVPATPPALVTPAVFRSILPPGVTSPNFRLVRYLSFRTRAPPLA